jgi:two-component system NtrC family sensor kinase
VDLNQVIEGTLSVVWNELKYKAEVVKVYDALPPLSGYPQRLGQVFVNLLVNAAQSIEGRGEIRIETRSGATAITVVIADTGCGIPPSNLGRIFDPFFTTKEVGKGTGLGLHVVQNIVQQHNGRIEVESAPDRGTTFTLTLPLEETKASTAVSASVETDCRPPACSEVRPPC